jgi:hypothetical protein
LLAEAKKLGETPIELYAVSYLKPAVRARGMGDGSDFEQYRVKETLIEYPPSDFVDKLFTPGTVNSTTVLADQPGNIQYVAVVTHRVEPTVMQFQRDTSPSYGMRPNQLLSELEQRNRVTYRFEVRDEMRKKAGFSLVESAPSLTPE